MVIVTVLCCYIFSLGETVQTWGRFPPSGPRNEFKPYAYLYFSLLGTQEREQCSLSKCCLNVYFVPKTMPEIRLEIIPTLE